MVTITKATAADNIFETFYDLVFNNVTDPNPPDDGSARKWVFSSFPQSAIDVDSDDNETRSSSEIHYPLVEIDAPELVWETATIGRNWANITLNLYVYSTKRSQSVQLMDTIVEAVETRRTTDLLPLNVTMFNVDRQSSDVQFHGEVKLHRRTSEISCRFEFKRTL